MLEAINLGSSGGMMSAITSGEFRQTTKRTPTSIVVQITALSVFTVLVLFLRRPDQFTHPYIWAEDGVVVLGAYAERGLASIVEPVAGYHILVSKLITLTAFKTAFIWAPEIALILSVVFICVVVAAIAFAPTLLPCPILCALATLLVPTDPEVFAVSLLAFWWAGLLIVLALLWDNDNGPGWLRMAFIILGGLSSSLAVPFAALFLLRAAVERRRTEYLAALVAITVGAVQAITIRNYAVFADTASFSLAAVPIAADKFAGFFIAGVKGWRIYFYPGFVVLAFMMAAAWIARARLRWHIILLALAWAAVCAATMIRVQIDGLHPTGAGPRYFFYPFVLLTWVSIWIAAKSSTPMRVILAGGYLFGFASAWSGMSRRHDPVSWRDHVEACAQAQTYRLPVHTDGRTNAMWHLTLSGEQCRRMIEAGIIRP